MASAKVGVLMGSDSDLEVMRKAVAVLSEFNVSCEVRVISAHRTPQLAAEYASTAEERGIRVVIAGAGAAAHLAGVLAAHTILPVIGVPLAATPLAGTDALYATVQMPGGIPVAAMAIGGAGAKNAALFALEILALSDESISVKLKDYRVEMAKKVAEKDARVRKELGGK
ncbi:MAG: 5-(carboxyamino)imidazole ribonucleotide mutase [Planctomycetota bacterium]